MRVGYELLDFSFSLFTLRTERLSCAGAGAGAGGEVGAPCAASRSDGSNQRPARRIRQNSARTFLPDIAQMAGCRRRASDAAGPGDKYDQ